MVNRLLLRSTLRHLQQHRLQALLSIIGIAIGVAVIIAVDLANQSARQAFLLSAESLTGKATHQIVAGPRGIPEAFYRQLRLQRQLQRSAPVIEGVLLHGAQRLQLIGIDPLAERPFRQFGSAPASGITSRLLSEPDTILLSRITADQLGLGSGDSLQVVIAGRSAELQIVGLLEGDNPAILEGLLLADISTAQELLKRTGRLDRIDLILNADEARRLQQELPQGMRLVVPATRSRVMAEMITAFQTNLSAMSLLAMLVGAFLIYNTMTFSVVRRRKLFATLRVVGVTRGALLRLLLLEALVLGLIGTSLGMLLGIFSAHYLVQLVTRTINDLYFVLTVTQLLLTPATLLKGLLIGIGITLLAALAPAFEAAATLPASALRRSQLERRVSHGVTWLALAGLLILLSGLLLAGQQRGVVAVGFSGLFLIIGGYSMLVPLVVLLLNRFARQLADRSGLLLRYAIQGITANLSRTGFSISALSVAVATTLGVSIMVTSFRATVEDWLGYTLSSDIYVSARSHQADGSSGSLLPQTLPLVRALPGVVETSSGRRARISSQYGPVELLALGMASRSHQGFRFTSTPLDDIWPRYRRGEVLLVSEPYAYRHHLNTGDRLLLNTPQGPKSWPIGAIFYDYGSDQGLISLARGTYARLWDDESISTIGIYLDQQVELKRSISQVRNALGGLDQGLRIRSNRQIREHSIAVFDRTFAITQILRVLAVGVAFIGVLSSLMALQLERTWEQAVLRATGATPRQLTLITLLQTGLIGLYAGLLSLPLGWLMSKILIEVINRDSFGWSITTRLPVSALAEALLLALVAALLAGIYPSWRINRVQPALALREE